MTAKLVPDGLWEVIEPLIPYRSPSRKAVGRVYPIEFASGVFCLFFAAAFLGRCCPRNWVGSGMTCWRRLRDCRDLGLDPFRTPRLALAIRESTGPELEWTVVRYEQFLGAEDRTESMG